METNILSNKQEKLDKLVELANSCRLCPLHEGTKQAVVYDGTVDAYLMLIGEA